MRVKHEPGIKTFSQDPYKIVTERLGDGCGDLQSFYFHNGANFYVFSYEREGSRRHTFVDVGDFMHHDRILAILNDNHVTPGNIERIIITHRHRDHWGLISILAEASKAKILVHANFRNFIEGEISRIERMWLSGLDPSQLRHYDIEYLTSSPVYGSISISSLQFTRLREPIELGLAGCIDILDCPESDQMHSQDQLIVIYSPGTCEKRGIALDHADDLIFAGDLWLMHGPLFMKGFRQFSRRLRIAYYRIKGYLSGAPIRRWDPREQDTEVKEALKRGFCHIRVKPGHGEEFLGTRIIPFGLLADRDILSELGYPMDSDKSLLKKDNIAPRVFEVLEKAYENFKKELHLWEDQDYDENEISDLLVRIYREQEGGGPLAEEDRRERRARLKVNLARMRDEEAGAASLRQVAGLTLAKLTF